MENNQIEMKIYHKKPCKQEFAIEEFTYSDYSKKYQARRREINTAVLSGNKTDEFFYPWRDIGQLYDSLPEAEQEIENFKKQNIYPISQKNIEIK